MRIRSSVFPVREDEEGRAIAATPLARVVLLKGPRVVVVMFPTTASVHAKLSKTSEWNLALARGRD